MRRTAKPPVSEAKGQRSVTKGERGERRRAIAGERGRLAPFALKVPAIASEWKLHVVDSLKHSNYT